MRGEKIGIALSGGVDSSVSAALLQEQGNRVHGFFMRLPVAGSEDQTRRVRAVARKLAIPLFLVDMRKYFSDRVIAYFLDTYLQGLTPNPCVICNRRIKFGLLAEEMRKQGMLRMATGHYARIERSAHGLPMLRRGIDSRKDQSYFLCRLSGSQLQQTVLPLGGLTKKEVRRMAAAWQLQEIHGPESQDVCFLAGETIPSFFAAHGLNERPGDILTVNGRVIGRHRGLWHYTIGQRRGLNLPDATPWYVSELDAAGNRVLVCKEEELLTRRVMISDVRWHGGEPPLPWHGMVQIRGRHAPSPARVDQIGGKWYIDFERSQRAITPGQFAVFYRQDVLMGSGIMMRSGYLEESPG
ncbi:MAG TPA: tRNA 2-thiouridine(34) synthase MnmA [Desulfobacteraceae bacterium]|nr:tRNA 2-thiouridine(34) synthase MnmA [Desulfobacteraceae bacterium]